jgi:hypothetical protein
MAMFASERWKPTLDAMSASNTPREHAETVIRAIADLTTVRVSTPPPGSAEPPEPSPRPRTLKKKVPPQRKYAKKMVRRSSSKKSRKLK